MARYYEDYDYGFPAYITVADRKRKAQEKIKKLSKKGEQLSPVVIEGRSIVKTFWGKAWCKNIESYQDYESRLPRGRSYARHGAVIDLKIEKGKITAQVMGSELYEINITIKELSAEKWARIKGECGGKIDSLINLIQGKLSPEIMELLCRKEEGLFPSPKEILLVCNCPDWSDLCKHLAAVMYGVGARLDKQPELLFLLRGVDQNELFSSDFADSLVADAGVAADIESGNLAGIFGIELDDLDGIDIELPAAKKPSRAAKAKAAPKKAKAAPKKVKAAPKKAKAESSAVKKPGRPAKVEKSKSTSTTAKKKKTPVKQARKTPGRKLAKPK